MSSTPNDPRPSRHTVTRSRRAAAAEKHAAAKATPEASSKTAPKPGQPVPVAKPTPQDPTSQASAAQASAAQASDSQKQPSPANQEHGTSNGAKPDTEAGQERGGQRHNRQPSEAELARREAVAAYPFVAVTLGASGIHPATSRLITFDAVTHNEAGDIGESLHMVFSPDTDPGPVHQHGLSHEEVAAGVPFSKALKRVDRIIDGRTIIVHDATVTWGFLVSEARRAMTAAARQNRSRNRNSRSRSRRIKVGHIPRPVAIIDTLATARRQEVTLKDVRLAAVAIASGIATTPPKATVERAQQRAEESAREQTTLLWQLHKEQARKGEVVELDPQELRADKFGLQRSHIRVDAMEAPRMHHNPGPYVPGKELVRGMEFVVAPEVAIDPDILIEAAMREEMNYSEKLSRETSIVVCNETTDLVGKAMHAERKNIPLMGDEAFLAALERIEEPGPEPVVEHKPTTAPRPQQRRNPASGSAPRRSTSPARSQNSGAQLPADADEAANRPQRKSSRRRRRRRNSNPNANTTQRQNKPNNPGQATQSGSEGASASKSSDTPAKSNAANGNNSASGNNSEHGNKSQGRRRRRGGRGGRNRNRNNGSGNGSNSGTQSAS